MASINVSTDIDASPEAVWRAVEDIGTHVRWMADAEAIRFTSERRQGEGTTFECDTKVGPFRLTDEMAVTAWEPGLRMGVRHEGLVTGSGAFELEPLSGGRTRFTWAETLRFPWWMGGPLGAALGAPVLKRIWRANLRRLKAIVEAA